MSANKSFFRIEGDWREALDHISRTMRDMSLQEDPQAVVRIFGEQVRNYQRTDGFVALSRRGLMHPQYRITRSSRWTTVIDPWKQGGELPVLSGGLMGELLYGDVPRLIEEIEVADDDPGREYFEGHRSLIAIPHYDHGVGLNMVLMLGREPGMFPPEQALEWIWISSLFGRATQNLVLSAELKKTYELVERELKIVAGIQRSLLPKQVPAIPTLDIATFYETSKWAGGDYYDFFPLPEGKWGILIADVSGHGTPAAVLMAVTHSLAHGHVGPHDPPSFLLEQVNRQLATLYTADNEAFVTAFYGLYDPATRLLTYSSAGHNPPRLMRCDQGVIESMDGARSLPLGLLAEEAYENSTLDLHPGDQITFYTDGITEAVDPAGRMFGLERLDAILSRCGGNAQSLVDDVVAEVRAFTAGAATADDQTLVGVIVS